MPSETITCTDCKKTFEFSEKDQAFFASLNYTKPRRCKPCREARKAKNPNPPSHDHSSSPAGISKHVEWINTSEPAPRRDSRDRRSRGRRDDY